MPDDSKISFMEGERLEQEKREMTEEELKKAKETQEYQTNLNRLLQQVHEYLDERAREELKKPRTVDLLEKEVSFDPPPVRTLETITQEISQHKGAVTSIRESLKKFSLRASGVKNAEEFLPLLYYLEDTVKTREVDTVIVKKSKVEKIVKSYERKGYKVEVRTREFHREDKDQKDNVKLRIEREHPYKPSKETLKELPTLLHAANDPVEMIERLKGIGFRIDGHAFSHHLNDLKEFVHSPEIGDMVKLFHALGMKSKYAEHPESFRIEDYRDTSAGKIKDIALREEKRVLFAPENLRKAVNYYRKLQPQGEELTLDQLPQLEETLEFFADRETYKLFTFLFDNIPDKPDQSKTTLQTLRALRYAEVDKPFSAIANENPWVAQQVLTEIRAVSSYPSDTYNERLAETFREYSQSRLITLLLHDKEAAEFTKDILALIGETHLGIIGDTAVASFVEVLKGKPESLVVCRLLNEWGGIFQGFESLQKKLEKINYIVNQQQERLKLIVKPEFGEFVQQMEEKLGVPLNWRYLKEVADCYGSFYNLSQSKAFSQALQSEKCVAFFKRFTDDNKFNPEQFAALAENPQLIDRLERFESIYGIKIKPGTLHMLPEFFAAEEFEELLKPETVQFYKKLHSTYYYEFSPTESALRGLVARSKDSAFQEKIFEKETIDFVKEAFVIPALDYHYVRNIDKRFYPVVKRLSTELKMNQAYFITSLDLEAIDKDQDVIIPTAKQLRKYASGITIQDNLSLVREIGEKKILDALPKKAPLLLGKDYESLLRDVLYKSSDLIKDDSDLEFLNMLVGKYSKVAYDIIQDYLVCLKQGVIETKDKAVVAEFLDHFRILAPAILTGFIEAKQAGTTELYLTQLKASSEKLTGALPMSDEERARPYYSDLIRAVYQNNAGNWTDYQNNASCEDRLQDLKQFTIKPRYEIDLFSAAEVSVKEGKELDSQAIENLKQEILTVANNAKSQDYDPEKMKASSRQAVNAKFQEQQEQGLFQNVPAEQLTKPEEKLFLLMAEALYGNSKLKLDEMKPLVIEYEFAEFEDIRDYIQGTSDRVSRANNQDYALLCELNTFFSDRVKEIMRRCAQVAWKNPAIAAGMPEYFEKLRQELSSTQTSERISKLQVDKLGLTEGFIKQLRRTLAQNTKKHYSDEQIKRAVHLYEVMAQGLQEEKSSSPSKRTLAFYGQLKAQREKTLEAVQAITGKTISPEEIHLEEINLQQLLETSRTIREGKYDEEQFATYTVQRMLDIFEPEKAILEHELDKFVSASGSQREVINAYIDKTKETANARMVGGVCVSGDNPKKVGNDCLWNMPNYFELVLQDPETYRCLGLSLLHYFEESDGKKILTASLNPSSTYLYSVDEKALFEGIVGALETFAKDNNIDEILLSKNPQIRTNRTGGAFERAMNERISEVDEQYAFDGPRLFSRSPLYYMQEDQNYKSMDVIWKNLKKNTAGS